MMTDKSVIVVAGATHREGFLDEYEAQLAKADIPFHLEPLHNLPQGANSITMRRRIEYMRRVCEKFIDYERIVMTDAWDVLFYGTKKDLLEKVPYNMIVSAERNCYPEADLAPRFTFQSPWRYANNGMLAGSPKYILPWLALSEQSADLDILDQAWFNRRCVDGHKDVVKLDTATDLFYVVSAWLEDGSLNVKRGLPYNSFFGTYPNFIHFSGKCPDGGFREMMENGK